MTVEKTVNAILGVWDEIKAAQSPDSSSGTAIDWSERASILLASAQLYPVIGSLPKLGEEVKNWSDDDKANIKAIFVANFSLNNEKHEAMGERIYDLVVELADFAYDWLEISGSGEGEAGAQDDRNGLGNDPGGATDD